MTSLERYAALLDSFLSALLSQVRGSFIFDRLLRANVPVPALRHRLNKFIIWLLQSDASVFEYRLVQNIVEAIVSADETTLVNLSTTGARSFIAGLKQRNDTVKRVLHNAKKFANAVMKMIKNGSVDCAGDAITHPFYPGREIQKLSLVKIPNSVNLVAVYAIEYVSGGIRRRFNELAKFSLEYYENSKIIEEVVNQLNYNLGQGFSEYSGEQIRTIHYN